MSTIEFQGFAIVWDENGIPQRIEAEHVPHSGRKIEPDSRVLREARQRLRELEDDSDSSSPRAA